VTVSHEAFDADVHPQAVGAITRTDADPPDADADPDVDSSAKVQVVPACVTPTLWPAIVSVPDRATVESAFDETPTVSVALPVPVNGATDAHAASLKALHEQFGPFAVTPIVPDASAGPNGLPRPVVFSVTLHASGSWVIWNGCPPMVSVPVRAYVVELGSIWKTRVPGPVPDAPDVTVIQLGPGTVLYVQPAGVITSTDPALAPAGAEALYGLNVTVQSMPACETENV
jgi:hypothetical protein